MKYIKWPSQITCGHRNDWCKT